MFDEMGVLGHGGEFKPRFGLWLNTSPECTAIVDAILADGYDCDVVLKYGSRCYKHAPIRSFRPVIALSEYRRLREVAPITFEVEPCDKDAIGGCYVREVYFPNALNLRKRRLWGEFTLTR